MKSLSPAVKSAASKQNSGTQLGSDDLEGDILDSLDHLDDEQLQQLLDEMVDNHDEERDEESEEDVLESIKGYEKDSRSPFPAGSLMYKARAFIAKVCIGMHGFSYATAKQ